MASSRTKVLGIGLLCVVLFALKKVLSKEQIDALLEAAEGETGPRGVAFVMVINLIVAIFGLPVTPVEFFCGYKFGMLAGFGVVVVGKQLGGAVAYFIGRFFLRDFLRTNLVPKWKILQAFDGAFAENSWKMAFVFRSMYLPTSVKNYGCAALGCPFWPSMCASMVFGPLYAAANIYAGSTSRTMRSVASSGGEGVDWVSTARTVFSGLLFVGASAIALKEVKKQLAKLDEAKLVEAKKDE